MSQKLVKLFLSLETTSNVNCMIGKVKRNFSFKNLK